jgi:hypothetical protein
MVLNLILGYVVGALKDFGAKVNWPQLKTQLDAELKALVKWGYAEAQAEAMVNGLLDACADVLSDEDAVKGLLASVAAKDWTAAVAELKALLQKEWKPEGTEAKALLAALVAA